MTKRMLRPLVFCCSHLMRKFPSSSDRASKAGSAMNSQKLSNWATVSAWHSSMTRTFSKWLASSFFQSILPIGTPLA